MGEEGTPERSALQSHAHQLHPSPGAALGCKPVVEGPFSSTRAATQLTSACLLPTNTGV